MPDAGKAKVSSVGKSKIEIGRFTYGYEKMTIKQWGEGAKLTIGSFCSIADELTIILGGNHRLDWATTFPFGHIFKDELGGKNIVGHPQTNGDVVVGNDVWLGRKATIMSGVKIGDGAVVAANSNVVKDIGNYEIWGGNPAVRIRKRFSEDIIAEFLALRWWDLEVELIRQIRHLLSQPPSIGIIKEINALVGR